MTQNKTDNKQALKKYGVFAAMGIVFCISMWFIFKPSKADLEKEQQQAGMNANIPDPQNTGMVANKIEAYEQELIQQKKDARMLSLQEYSFELGKSDLGDDASLPLLEADSILEANPDISETGNSSGSRKQSSGYSSSSAYADMNKTLEDFYEKKEEPEKEALKKELEELKKNLHTVESDVKKPTYEEQVAIMEKSYELAAKYMGGYQEQAPAEPASEIQISPVKQLHHNIVSALSQPMSNQEFIEQYAKVRNTGFNTIGNTLNNHERNTISAVIHDNQTVISGQMVRVRITEAMMISNHLIPVNTILTGTCRISGERVNIAISSIENRGAIHPVELTAYDTDGQQGIYIPGSMEISAVKEIAGNMGSSLGSGINISQQSAGDQLLSDLGRGVIQGTSQYIATKAREVKVTLKAGHHILLLFSEQ